MPRYVVTIKEIHTADISISASDETQALEEAEKYIEENEIESEYYLTLEPDQWNVEKESDHEATLQDSKKSEQKLPTYNDLLKWLQEKTPEQLEMNLSLYDSEQDEFYSLRSFDVTSETDVLDCDHPFLIL